MPDDGIDDLLERWGDLRRQGQDVSAEELCRDCPELLTEIQRRIKALKATEWLEKPLLDDAPAKPARKERPSDFGLPAALGRYRLDELIGTGGFGQVWRGFDPDIHRAVAVKVARPDRVSTPEQAQAFFAEAQKVGQLRHPGIVPVHVEDRDGEWCYIISDFIDGGNLAERIADNCPNHQQAARLVADIADILHFAHRQGVVHRDIKPANILLDKDGKPFVGDFGIAVSSFDARQTTSSTAGTLAYMSPEQVRGEQQIDARTDIYSLGVVFYELLTGQVPFVAPNPVDLRTAILSAEPKPPRAIDDTIPPALERICLWALAKNPLDRFPTAKDFAARLRAAVDGKRRKVWPIVVSLGVVIILAAGFGKWLAGQYRQAEQTKSQSIKAGKDLAHAITEHIRKDTTFQIGGPTTQNSTRPESARPDVPLTVSRITGIKVDLTGRKLTDDDFQQLSQHLTLRQLILADTTTTDAQLSQLRSVLGLEELDLTGTQVTDAGLTWIANHPTFRSLSLARTGITDAGLKHLGSVRIRSLNLSGTKISDAGLAHLTDRYGAGGDLTDLDLSNTLVTDACVGYLKQMTRLEHLRLTGTKVSEEGVGQLKAALPKCRVER